MTSYISTQSLSSSLRQSILKMQSGLAAAQTEVATGNYADIGLTLGDQAGESVSLQAEGSFLQTISDTNTIVSTRLAATQNVLVNLQGSAQDMLDALLATNGSAVNANTIQATAQNGLRSLISNLNSTLSGDYIFAGTNTSDPPITDFYGASAANKQAVDSAFFAAFGMSQSNPAVSSISGASMQSFLDNQFATLFQGANWTGDWSSASNLVLTNQISASQTENTSVSSNEPVFQQLAQAYAMLADLGAQNLSSGAYQAVVGTAERVLSSAIGNLTDLQAGIGTVQSSVASATNKMSLQMNILSTQVSNLESVNPYEASTRVTDLQTQIQTSYSLTSQLRQLSLVKFL